MQSPLHFTTNICHLGIASWCRITFTSFIYVNGYLMTLNKFLLDLGENIKVEVMKFIS